MKKFCIRGHARTPENLNGYQCRQCDREYGRRYRAANLEKVRERARLWAAAHVDVSRNWIANNKAKVKAIKRRWAVKNPVKRRELARAGALRRGPSPNKKKTARLYQLFGTARVPEEVKQTVELYWQIKKEIRKWN